MSQKEIVIQAHKFHGFFLQESVKSKIFPGKSMKCQCKRYFNTFLSDFFFSKALSAYFNPMWKKHFCTKWHQSMYLPTHYLLGTTLKQSLAKSIGNSLKIHKRSINLSLLRKLGTNVCTVSLKTNHKEDDFWSKTSIFKRAYHTLEILTHLRPTQIF